MTEFRQTEPLLKGEVFGAGSWFNAATGKFFGAQPKFSAEHFARRGEAAMKQGKKFFLGYLVETVATDVINLENRRIYFGRWPKGAARDGANVMRRAVNFD